MSQLHFYKNEGQSLSAGQDLRLGVESALSGQVHSLLRHPPRPGRECARSLSAPVLTFRPSARLLHTWCSLLLRPLVVVRGWCCFQLLVSQFALVESRCLLQSKAHREVPALIPLRYGHNQRSGRQWVMDQWYESSETWSFFQMLMRIQSIKITLLAVLIIYAYFKKLNTIQNTFIHIQRETYHSGGSVLAKMFCLLWHPPCS